MSSLLDPSSLQLWVAIVVAVGLFVGLVLRLSSPPKELAGVDLSPGEEAFVALTASPSSTLRAWGTFEVGLGEHPDEGNARATFEARSADRVVAAGQVDSVGWRIVHRGRNGGWAFTVPIATVAMAKGAPFEFRATITPSTPVVAARLYVSR